MTPDEFRSFLPEDHIKFIKLKSSNTDKYEFLVELVKDCLYQTEEAKYIPEITEEIIDREKSVSTGVGMGVAIPHCSSNYIKEITLFMIILDKGLEFLSIDESLVRIIVLILFPKKLFDRYVKVLASLSRALNEQKVRDKLLETLDPKIIRELMVNSASIVKV